MRIKTRASTRRRGGRVASNMPEIEFNMRAIIAIKKRKKKVGKGHSNNLNRREGKLNGSLSKGR